MKFKNIAFYWVVAFLLPLFAVYQALTVPIEEYSYDTAEFHIYRAVVYSDARADGWLFPRWVQPINAGLGGPFFSLYPPFVYSMMDVLHSAGISHPIGWRVLVALALFAASLGMFGFALALFNRADIALGCATVFAYSGFLLRDLFERGAPSGMALALFPAMLWLLVRFVTNPSGWRLLLASLCLAVIILIHSQTAFLLVPLVCIVGLYLFIRGKVKFAARSLLPLLGGVLLSAFYMLPFPIEVKQVQFDNALQIAYANPAIRPLRPSDILGLPRSLDVGIANNGMGVSPGGLVHALALPLGSVLIWSLYRRKRSAEAILLAGLVLLALFALEMQFESANGVWKAVPGLSVLLFRWRLLGILGIVTAIVVGFGLEQLPERIGRIGLVAFGVVYVAIHLGLIYPQLFYRYTTFSSSPTLADMQASAVEHRAFGLSSFDEFVPIARGAALDEAELQRTVESPIANLPLGGRLMEQDRRTGFLQLKIDSPVSFVAALRTLYFPGWVGYVDNKERPIEPEDPSGYILVPVPAGVHTLTLKYVGTTVQHIGEALTIITFLVLLVLAFLWRHRANATIGHPAMYPQPQWAIVPLILLAVAVKAVWVDPQTILFRNASTCAAVQDAQYQTDVWFGDRMRLCGLSLDSNTVRAGDTFRVTLYWQLEQPAVIPAESFVHLLGTAFNPETGNPLWGQEDKASPGEHPLMNWTTGKLYRDQYDLRVPTYTPPGDYQLEIGWRQPLDDLRLPPRIAQPIDPLSISSLDSLLFSQITVR